MSESHQTVAEMLVELADSPGGPCAKCDRRSRAAGVSPAQGKADGFEYDPFADQFYRRCEPCASERPYAWMKRVDPVRAEAWLKAHPNTILDKMIELVQEPEQKRRGFEFL